MEETHTVQRWHEDTGIVAFYSFCFIQEPLVAPPALKKKPGLRRAPGFDPLHLLFLSLSLLSSSHRVCQWATLRSSKLHSSPTTAIQRKSPGTPG